MFSPLRGHGTLRRSTSLIVLVAVLWLLLISDSLAEKLRCQLCGGAIQGKFFKYKAQGKTFTICHKCHLTAPRCGICNLPLKAPKGWNGRIEILCPRCYKVRKVCDICGKTIKGKSFKSSNTGEIYCQNCLNTAPKCASCKKPLRRGEGALIYGKKICTYCFEKRAKCSCCGLPIVGTQVSYKYADGIFCTHCNEKQPHCYVCGIPIGGKHLSLSDNRIMCMDCGKTSIFTPEELRTIHDKVVKFLKEELEMEVQTSYELKLALTRKELGGKDGEIEGKEQGYFTHKDGKSQILILSGVTETMCHETIAHEYAHAWHMEHGMRHADLETREGFAQWAGSKTLEHFGFKNALKRLRARMDPNYGTGYQKLYTVEKEKGVKEVFDFLAQKSSPKPRR